MSCAAARREAPRPSARGIRDAVGGRVDIRFGDLGGFGAGAARVVALGAIVLARVAV